MNPEKSFIQAGVSKDNILYPAFFKETKNKMSYSKVKSSFRPCSSSTSDQESMSAKKPTITNSTNNNKSPVPVIANCGVTKDMLHRKKSDGSVSDASTHSHLAGGKLTEAPGRLTPTCPGRMKAPPVCRNWALKRGASSVSVLFSIKGPFILLISHRLFVLLSTCSGPRFQVFFPRVGTALCRKMFGSGREESRHECGRNSIQY